MTKRRTMILLACLAILFAIATWQLRNRSTDIVADSQLATVTETGPTKLPRQNRLAVLVGKGSIAGMVKDPTGAAIASANVCLARSSQTLSSDLTRDPMCVAVDARGHYEFRELLSADYEVSAAAVGFSPSAFLPFADNFPRATETWFALSEVEKKTAVDIVLRRGGADVTGLITDINTGAIAHASVSITSNGVRVYTRSDDHGRYRAWASEGYVRVVASADGYARGDAEGHCPGSIDVALVPESTLSGTVIDVSGMPIAGAKVTLQVIEGFSNGKSDRSDSDGNFRIGHLLPGRYKVEAVDDNSFGQAVASTLLGLGQSVGNVVVTMHPARQITGAVVSIVDGKKVACRGAAVNFRDAAHEHWYSSLASEDGTIVARGVLPGTYDAQVSCPRFRSQTFKASVVVAPDDRGQANPLEWTLQAGASIQGFVFRNTGEPVPSADVYAGRNQGSGANSGDFARTNEKGYYEIHGLDAGEFDVRVSSKFGMSLGPTPVALLKENAATNYDVVLDASGSVIVHVVDQRGIAVRGCRVSVKPRMHWTPQDNLTNALGDVTLDGLRPWEYRIVVRNAQGATLRKPGTTDDDQQGELVTIVAGRVANLTLQVEDQRDEINGTVWDGTKVINDAFVVAVRQSDAANATPGLAPQQSGLNTTDAVLTDVEGRFKLPRLAAGSYIVRAFRRGGGEAIARDVAVGSNVRLAILKTATVRGVVLGDDGKPPLQSSVEISGRATDRSETFYNTDGKFEFADMPAGPYTITATIGESVAETDVELKEGEITQGITLRTNSSVTVTGTLIDAVTRQPIAGMTVDVGAARDGLPLDRSHNPRRITDEAGHFSCSKVPVGNVLLWARSIAWNFPYRETSVRRRILADAPATYDIGPIPIVRKKIESDETAGDAGITFVQVDDRNGPNELTIKRIDPLGPAAKTDLKKGDVISSIDGVDVGGYNNYLAIELLKAPVGTAVTFVTKRGSTVSLVLAARR
jgi:hypothetical protein